MIFYIIIYIFIIQEGMNEKYMDILKEYLKKNKRKYHIAFKWFYFKYQIMV